jgi:hypothetical protein
MQWIAFALLLLFYMLWVVVVRRTFFIVISTVYCTGVKEFSFEHARRLTVN